MLKWAQHIGGGIKSANIMVFVVFFFLDDFNVPEFKVLIGVSVFVKVSS